MVAAGADAGLAFDGDADRVVAVAGDGTLVDGDRIIAICAADLFRRGRLPGGAVVLTVMSNLGLRRALAALGIGIVETPVGDRYVLEAMERRRAGPRWRAVRPRHLPRPGHHRRRRADRAAAARRRRPVGPPAAAALAADAMTRLPQVLRNVQALRLASPTSPAVAAVVAVAEEELGETGRVLLRPSGTEPLVRVMVEAPSEAQAVAVADRVCAAVEGAAGAV